MEVPTSRNKNKKLSNISQNSSKMTFQEFFINDQQQNKTRFKHKNNYINTTKYNILTFLPKSFLLQFARIPNIYFLATAIIQSIPIISPLTGATAIVSLIFVLSVSMIRELIEDISRYQYDKMNNDEIVTVYRDGSFIKVKSSTLSLGEIILIFDNEVIPCDMIIMDSSLPEGVCYVETSSLDGEKALKEKISHKLTQGFISHQQKTILPDHIDPINLNGYCQCDLPNPDLNRLDGKIQLKLLEEENEYPISVRQMLLKGSILKHSGWVGGFVLYTGMNNKIILNSKPPRMKLSTIERNMSRFLIGIFIFQLLLGAVCSIWHYKSYNEHIEFYELILLLDQTPSMESFITFFTYLLLFNTLIPISLIISLEVVKIIQGFFIRWDYKLYSLSKKKFCKASTVSLNEELGNVNYIFTDKTGTLTCNKMVFKYCIIGDTCYEYKCNATKIFKEKDEDNHTNYKDAIKKEHRVKIIQIGNNYFYGHHQYKQPLEVKNNILLKKIDEIDIIDEFWKALCCAHECVCTKTLTGIEYTGICPDDVELVKTAAVQGYSFQKSQSDERKILIGTQEKTYKILNMLNFSSERKRMSIILRDGNEIKMYTKGADCEIKKRLNAQSSFNEYTNIISKCVDRFSGRGFRTLMVAYKTIDEETYNKWNSKLRNGEMNLAKKHTLIENCYNEIEKDLILLGATVVEDKLQENVPETISDLRLAGIKIWVLTGDKIDTAENIALSCNLISYKQRNFKICSIENDINTPRNDTNKELMEFKREFKEFLDYGNSELNHSSASDIKSDLNPIDNKKISPIPFSILIESCVLGKLFKNEEDTKEFMKIASYANSVICCRVSPLQKAEVVKQLKKFNSKAITLAIGDGGNDVSMIMEAHIGIGLYGEEGMRAVQASDYAIGEFQYLRRLLFYHGRTNSGRISYMILFFFYKNFVLTMVHFFFCFNCLASGQTIVDDWFITCYNLIFTALPLGVVACSDFDIREDDSPIIDEIVPLLYKESRDIPLFNIRYFIFSLSKGLVLGLLSFIFLIYSVDQSSIDNKGSTENLWYCSLNLYTSLIFSVSVTLLVHQRYIIFLVPLIMGITSWGFYFAFIFYVHYTTMFNSVATIIDSFSSLKFYLVLLLFLCISFIFDYIIEFYSIHFSEYLNHALMIKNYNKTLNKDKELPAILAKAKEFNGLFDNTIEDADISGISFYDSVSHIYDTKAILSSCINYKNCMKKNNKTCEPILDEKNSIAEELSKKYSQKIESFILSAYYQDKSKAVLNNLCKPTMQNLNNNNNESKEELNDLNVVDNPYNLLRNYKLHMKNIS